MLMLDAVSANSALEILEARLLALDSLDSAILLSAANKYFKSSGMNSELNFSMARCFLNER